MAVAFVSQASATVVGASGTTCALTVPAPATIIAGNQLVAVVYQANNVTGIVTSPGWTLAGQATAVTSAGGNSAGGNIYVLTKAATGSETASYVFTSTQTNSSQVSALAGSVLQYSGVNTTPLDGSAAFTTYATATASVMAPSVTAAGAGMLLVGYGSFNGNTFTVPAGTTNRSAATSAGNSSIAVNEKTLASAGASGTNSATQTAAPAVSMSLILAPSAVVARPRRLAVLQAVGRSNNY